MKTKFKTYVMAVAAIATIGCISLTSCEKDNTALMNHPYDTKTIEDGEIPFDYIGESHNKLLYLWGTEFKDTLDFYAELATKGMLTEEMQEGLAELLLQSIANIELKHGAIGLSVEECTTITSLTEKYMIDDYSPEKFYDTDLGIAILEELGNLTAYDDIDEQIQMIRYRELTLLGGAQKSLDTCVAIALNVMEHSLSFWHTAYEEKDHPWHNYLIATDNWSPNNYAGSKGKILNKIVSFAKNLKDNVIKGVKNFFHSKYWGLALTDATSAGIAAYTVGPHMTTPFTYGACVIGSGVVNSALAAILNKKTM